jgi:hypothetical protein
MGPRRNRSIVGATVAGFICAGLSAFGLFVVASGSRLSGGIPFIPDGLNQGIGAAFIGLGAVFTAWMAGYAFYDAWRLRRELNMRRHKSG